MIPVIHPVSDLATSEFRSQSAANGRGSPQKVTRVFLFLKEVACHHYLTVLAPCPHERRKPA
jgi:ribosomal protein RSM22 (predicted rRNA methylase)